MSYRSVDAGRGFEWIKDSANSITKNPLVFLGGGLVALLIICIPAYLGARRGFTGLIGNLAMAPLVPLIIAGFLRALRNQDSGGTATFNDLFWGFQNSPTLVPLATLGAPSAASAVITFILGLVLPFMLVGLVSLLMALAVFALVFFAIPRVTFDSIDPIEAMKESLDATLANIAPILVYVALIFGAAIVLWVVFVVLIFIPILGWLVAALIGLGLFLVGMPWYAGVSYAAYNDVYGSAAVAPAAPPPPPPV